MKKIANTVLLLGIPVNILGYHYIKEALDILANDQMAIHSIIKNIYTPVAEKFGTTTSKVERGMRHAVSLAVKGKAELFVKYFGDKHPNNGMFLAMVAEMLRLEELEKKETA